MSSIALFGGSFDPPHIGHIQIVEKLKQLDFIDKIIIMPTYLNPFKERFGAPAELRLQWLRKIFEGDAKVEVSDFEVRQRTKVPTVRSVEELKKRYDTVYVVIGADNLPKLHLWHEYERLKELAKFIVVTREGYDLPQGFDTIRLSQPVSSTQLRKEPKKELLPPKVADEIYRFYKERNENES